jgi:hypothetical protein
VSLLAELFFRIRLKELRCLTEESVMLEKDGEEFWTDRVRNEEVLHKVKEERNIVHTTKRRKANWIGHILRRNCLLKHVIEGKIEGRIEMTED